MTSPSTDGSLTCTPLTLAQARMVTRASPVPTMVVNVVESGFTVQAVDSLLGRLVIGAGHPAGPVPDEVIADDGFGVLGPAMRAAVAFPERQQVLELPIGDEPTWFEVTVTAIADETECRQLLLVAADRTADHDIEQRHRRAARRFQAMVDHAPGLILLVDSTGRIIRCSPAVDRLLGVAADELVGRAIFELMHPDTLARAASVFNQILSSPGEPLALSDFRLAHTEGTTLWCEATVTNLLHDDDVAAVVFNAHDITARRMAEERLALAATSDALTGLANRRRLEIRLGEAFDEAARSDGSVGLALVDLDDFKLVNDGLGHDVGDDVLRVLASRFEGLIGDRGMAARVGGDEFALLLAEVRNDRELEQLADGIHESLRSPITVRGHDVYVRGSVGTTTGHHEVADAASMLRSADLALYRAKRNGRHQTVSYSAELQLEAEQRLATVTALQRALREGRLRVAYQPVVDGDGELVGAEALLRWEHDGELLNPGTFLGLAEDTGLILPIGSWVLEQVCQDFGGIRDQLPQLQWLSVNLSSRQLLDERLPLLARRTLEAHGVEPSSIAVEISESTIRDDDGRAAGVLAELGGIRVMLALDDLSVDQSTLSTIGRLPFSALKLDRRFVQQLDVEIDGQHRAIAGAVLDLAAEHGVTVVAEGVETDAQAEILRGLDCPLYQGFLFGAPVDLGTFITRAG